MEHDFELLALLETIRRAYCRETSELENAWTPEVPSLGQCHVTAMIIHQIYGGKILRGLVNGKIVHYYNVLENMQRVDATEDQFEFGINFISEISDATNEKIWSSTRDKYRLLLKRTIFN